MLHVSQGEWLPCQTHSVLHLHAINPPTLSASFAPSPVSAAKRAHRAPLRQPTPSPHLCRSTCSAACSNAVAPGLPSEVLNPRMKSCVWQLWCGTGYQVYVCRRKCSTTGDGVDEKKGGGGRGQAHGKWADELEPALRIQNNVVLSFGDAFLG
ncbi:hypothetical protein BDU57DRAFT_508393 [Ampelomyces quisqualis]|uniref:Uncharacterized protein n=1 Tax=Ampelomyces quisqualis TaxID=50730 RepID=A0A6A5QZF3_AMPQU|nr:hypothetical protein BDU57DRAFT_508393 [Ampelomyces quisqualis]